MTPTHLMSSALEVRDFAERLPERINRILESLAANDLRLKIEVIITDRSPMAFRKSRTASRSASSSPR